jgi:uncharacterized protein YkwD
MSPSPPARPSRSPCATGAGRRLLAPALLLAVLAAPGARAQGTTATTDATGELLAAVNALRTGSGLAPLRAEPALVRVASRAASSAAAAGTLTVDGVNPTDLSSQIRAAGYQPHVWRQRLVQGPRDAEAVLRHWRESDPGTFAEVVLGDFEALGAARSAADPPVWSLFVALPRRTWEERQAAPLDDLAGVRATILDHVNVARAAAGRVPVVAEERLTAAAQEHARDMLARGFYDHTSPEGDGPAQRARTVGYRWRFVAENIAKGLIRHDEVVGRWMGSSGHRRNILDSRAREVGIGVAWGVDRDGRVVALWVLLLGSRA